MADTSLINIDLPSDQTWKLISNDIVGYKAQTVVNSAEVMPHTSSVTAPVLGAGESPMFLGLGNILNRTGIWWGRSAQKGKPATIAVVS